MRTLRIVLEYDGTNFSGWQEQAGLPPQQTIQGALQSALARLVREPVRVRGASRTDAGVHARGQVVAFETTKDNVPVIGFMRGLGQFLPKAIAVRQVEEAPAGWDPRRTSPRKALSLHVLERRDAERARSESGMVGPRASRPRRDAGRGSTPGWDP